MRLLRLQVEVVQDVQQMVPVLHEEDVGLVHHQQFDGGQEVVVAVLLALGPHQHAQPEGRRYDYVR